MNTPTVGLEMLVVFLARGGFVEYLADDNSHALVFACSEGSHPHSLLLERVEKLGLQPLVVHSTSWRLNADQLVLTYVVAVRPSRQWPSSLQVRRPNTAERLIRG